MKKIIKKFEDVRVKSWFCLCMAISFMLCVFAPLDSFFANKGEFWFELSHLLPALVLVFVIVTTILVLFSLLVFKMKNTYIVYGFFVCVFFFFYVQGNWIPRNYGVLNGKEIDWATYSEYAVASVILVFVMLFVWAIVIFKVKEKIYIIGKYLAIFLLSIQIVTLGTLFVQNVFVSQEKTVADKVVTNKGLFELSNNSNIVVFLLDAFDSSFMQELLNGDEAEKYKDIFKDFTYYPDSLAAYPTTKGSLPFILTGKWFENEYPYTEYVQAAYSDNEIYAELQKNEYSVGVYTLMKYLNQDTDIYVNVENGEYKVKDYFSFLSKVYKLVSFNYMPHQLKKFFFVDTGEFLDLKETKLENKAYSLDVPLFNSLLTDEGIDYIDEGNVFRFYHLNGTHEPLLFDKNLTTDSEKVYDFVDVAAGNCTMLNNYFNALKDAGIYDNTTIIVMADHGYVDYWQNPLFMMKNVGEDHEFIVSKEQMSWEYLADVFVALANGECVDETYISSCKSEYGDRRFLYYTDNAWNDPYFPGLWEMYAEGHASSPVDLKIMRELYSPEKEEPDFSYQLGTVLSFGEAATANEHCIYGFSASEGTATWTYSTTALAKFVIEEEYNDLELQIDYGIYGEEQQVSIYVNDNQIADYLSKGSESKRLVIPKEFVKDGVICLRFKLADAVSPKSLGKGEDVRQLALRMKSICISNYK